MDKETRDRIRRKAEEYCRWADSPEGMEVLRHSSEEARKWGEEMRKNALVSDEIMRKRYTI